MFRTVLHRRRRRRPRPHETSMNPYENTRRCGTIGRNNKVPFLSRTQTMSIYIADPCLHAPVLLKFVATSICLYAHGILESDIEDVQRVPEISRISL